MNVICAIFCLMQFSVACGISVFRFGEENGFMCHCKNISEPCDQLTGNCTSGCADEWFGPACQYRDLAHLNGYYVSQTSTRNDDTAGKAIDGSITTCSRTKRHPSTHWKIWLPQNEFIVEMYILTKNNSIKKFNSTKLFVEHVSEAKKHNMSYKPNMSQQCSDITPTSNSFVIKCDPPMIGNQVRIQLEGDVNLVLCDVKINGGRNLAFGKPTYQSSNLHEDNRYNSSNAVDGNHTSASRTASTYNATWGLELGYSALLQHINIVMKPDLIPFYEKTLLPRAFDVKKHSWSNKGGRISTLALYQEVTGILLTTGNNNLSMAIHEVELFGDCTEHRCGFDCKSTCHNGSDTSWNKMSTNYSNAWRPEYDGEEDCDDGFHGINCSETCGSCRNGTSCDKVSGECPSGCSIGYAGNLCNTVAGQNVVAGIGMIVGVVAGVVFILEIALIIVCVLKGRTKRRESFEDVELHSGRTHDWNTVGFSDTNLPSPSNKVMHVHLTGLLTDRPKVESSRSKSGVQVAKLLQYVKMSLTSKEHIISEFQTIPYGLQYLTESAASKENIGKNCYKEIFPYDHSRVVLTSTPVVLHSDYINASFIQGHERENAYIAAQGPMSTCIGDFWRMVWEKDVRTVVMLTNIVEEKKVKCAEYWGSLNKEISYGTTTVSKESEHIYADYTIRRFKAFSENNRNDTRIVTQFHYRDWPDKSVPRSTSSLVQFWNVVRQADSRKFNTWLVHSSAGVGRTGTFIAMDLLYDEGEDLGTVDIHHCVQTLREQRVNMVQTKEQYKFLHALVVELLVLPSKQIHSDAFSEFYANLQSFDSHTGKSGLQLQYEGLQEETTFMNLVYESCKLQTADDKEDRFVAAKLDINKSKNRYQNVLPANEFRPFLSTNIPGCSNYINAVYVQYYFLNMMNMAVLRVDHPEDNNSNGTLKRLRNSYRRMRGFILTQTPTKQTAIDCCRLVIEEGIKVIVTFDHEWKGKADVGEYLPENGSIQLGPFTSTKLAETDENNYILRTYSIVQQYEEMIVYQFVYKKWPTKRIIPLDSHSVLNLIHIVDFTNRRENDNAILVQCLDGAERSGLFVVLMNIMEHLRYDSRVSIPHLIRCVRVRREQIIPNFEQYKFCHDILLSYVENHTTYAIM